MRHCDISYHKPAYYGSSIECTAEVKKITPARIIFEQRVTDIETQELLVEAQITLACVSAVDFKPIRLSKDIQNILK